mgnify:FL=1
MAENILPERKMPKLIVVVAFDRDDEGELHAVFGPAEQQSEVWCKIGANMTTARAAPLPPLLSPSYFRPSLGHAECGSVSGLT